jgi:hypothetical protein
MIVSLLVVARVVSAATWIRREAHFSRARCVIQAKSRGTIPGQVSYSTLRTV